MINSYVKIKILWAASHPSRPAVGSKLNYKANNALRHHQNHDTSSTQGKTCSEALYLLTLEGGWLHLMASILRGRCKGGRVGEHIGHIIGQYACVIGDTQLAI